MLDTPDVETSHIAQGAKRFPNPGTTERLISSIYGDIRIGRFFSNHDWYRRRYTAKSNNLGDLLDPGAAGHGYAYLHYTRETVWDAGDPFAELESDGFYFSPIINPSTRIDKSGGVAPLGAPESFAGEFALAASPDAAGAGEAPGESGLPDFVPGEWQSFGDAIETAGTWTLTESADAGMWTTFIRRPATRSFGWSLRNSGRAVSSCTGAASPARRIA